MANVVKIVVEAIDKTKVGLNTPLNSLKNIQLAAKALTPVFKAMGVAAGVALAKFAKDSVTAAEEMRRMNNTMLVATGTMELAAQEMGFVGDTANELGLEFKALAKGYAGIAAASKGTALEGEGVRSVFEGVSTAMSALSLSADDTRGVMTALQQIISKGTVSSDELKQQLGERLPGAIQIASRAMGVTTEELSKMLEQGKIVASEFLPKFAAEMKRTFGPAAREGAKSFTANINRLKNSMFQLMVAAGNELLPEVNQLTKAFVDFISEGDNGINTVTGMVTVMRTLKEVAIGVMGSFMILGTAIGVSLAAGANKLSKNIDRYKLLAELAASIAKEEFMERTGGVAPIDTDKFYYERVKLQKDFNDKHNVEIQVWKAIAEEIERVDKLLSGRDTSAPKTTDKDVWMGNKPDLPGGGDKGRILEPENVEAPSKAESKMVDSVLKEHKRLTESKADFLFIEHNARKAAAIDTIKNAEDLTETLSNLNGIFAVNSEEIIAAADEAERERLTALSAFKSELAIAGLDAETEQAAIAEELRDQQFQEDMARIDKLAASKEEKRVLENAAKKAFETQEAKDSATLAKNKQTILNQQVGATGAAFGNMAAASAVFFGKESAAYKVFAIGQAIASTYLAANYALATPAPWPLPQMFAAAAVVSGLANVAQISGIAHGGLTEVPSDQTFLLKQGERVLSPDQNEDFTEFIDGGGGGGGGGNGMIDLTINIDGQPLYSGISKASRDGRFTISARAVA
jgi:tape measure domain-containing protein